MPRRYSRSSATETLQAGNTTGNRSIPCSLSSDAAAAAAAAAAVAVYHAVCTVHTAAALAGSNSLCLDTFYFFRGVTF